MREEFNLKNADRKKTFFILISFLAIYVILGSTFLAIKVVVESAPAFFSMGVRFIIASLLLALFLPFSKGVKYRKREILNSAILGVFFFAGCMGLVAWAEKYIPSGIACVLSSTIPLWFLVFEVLLYKKRRPRIVAWLGVITGIVGVIVLVGIKDFTHLKHITYLPFLAVLFASILWSFTAIYSTKVDKPKNKKLDVSVQMFAGGIFNIILSLITK